MPKILIEENGLYGFDCSRARWATDQVHASYHQAGVHLKDADFIIEDEDHLLITEYKNANVPGASHPERFHPDEEKQIQNVVQKFYDTLHYLNLTGKKKVPEYVYVVEAPGSDSVMRKRLRNHLRMQLPFRLQENIGNGSKLIQDVNVVSIDEWNQNPVYGKFPIVPVRSNKES